MKIDIGPIEVGIPVPGRYEKSPSVAQQTVLALQVGESFVISGDDRHPLFYTSLKERLQNWANSRGIRLHFRNELDDKGNRIGTRFWRTP